MGKVGSFLYVFCNALIMEWIYIQSNSKIPNINNFVVFFAHEEFCSLALSIALLMAAIFATYSYANHLRNK